MYIFIIKYEIKVAESTKYWKKIFRFMGTLTNVWSKIPIFIVTFNFLFWWLTTFYEDFHVINIILTEQPTFRFNSEQNGTTPPLCEGKCIQNCIQTYFLAMVF